jgi:hypothetical protein
LSTKPSRLSARHPSYQPPYAQPVHNLTRKPATAPRHQPAERHETGVSVPQGDIELRFHVVPAELGRADLGVGGARVA